MLVDSNFMPDTRNVKKRYSELDESISDVLHRDDLNEYDKAVLYRRALSRYLVNKQTLEHEFDRPVKVQTVTTAAAAEEQDDHQPPPSPLPSPPRGWKAYSTTPVTRRKLPPIPPRARARPERKQTLPKRLIEELT